MTEGRLRFFDRLRMTKGRLRRTGLQLRLFPLTLTLSLQGRDNKIRR
jgi:hypothetical protein